VEDKNMELKFDFIEAVDGQRATAQQVNQFIGAFNEVAEYIRNLEKRVEDLESKARGQA